MNRILMILVAFLLLSCGKNPETTRVNLVFGNQKNKLELMQSLTQAPSSLGLNASRCTQPSFYAAILEANPSSASQYIPKEVKKFPISTQVSGIGAITSLVSELGSTTLNNSITLNVPSNQLTRVGFYGAIQVKDANAASDYDICEAIGGPGPTPLLALGETLIDPSVSSTISIPTKIAKMQYLASDFPATNKPIYEKLVRLTNALPNIVNTVCGPASGDLCDVSLEMRAFQEKPVDQQLKYYLFYINVTQAGFSSVLSAATQEAVYPKFFPFDLILRVYNYSSSGTTRYKATITQGNVSSCITNEICSGATVAGDWSPL